MAHGQRTPALLFLVAAFVLAGSAGRAEDEEVAPPVAKERSSPIARRKAARPDAVGGTVLLSNGERVAGKLYLTRGKRLRAWDVQQKRYRDIALSELSLIEVRVTRERVEREWRFREEGSDEKVFTGRSYPRLDFEMTLQLKDGPRLEYRAATGAPLYVQTPDGKRRRFLIQPHLKGEMGQTPEQLVYVKQVVFGPPEESGEACGPSTGTAEEVPVAGAHSE